MASPTVRGVISIVIVAIFLALTYNAFSSKGLSLLRIPPTKIGVSDSVLFANSRIDTHVTSTDSVATNDIKVIAPLHEQALRNPDSMKALVHAERENAVYNIITFNQMKRLLAAGRGVLLDARNEEDYRKGHIKGARNIPGQYPDAHFGELAELPRDTLVVIYCNNPECHLGRMLAEFMHVMGFKNMVLYDDGWDGWTKAGMPIDTTLGSSEVQQ